MPAPKKNIPPADPEVNKCPGTTTRDGRFFTTQVQGYVHGGVRIRMNYAVFILFVFCVVLTIFTTTLYCKVHALDGRNQELERTLHRFICQLDKDMDTGRFCGQSSEEVLEKGLSDRYSYEAKVSENFGGVRSKRDSGSKSDRASANATIAGKPERGGNRIDVRGLRGKVLKTEKRLRALKKRLASAERRLLSVNGSVIHRLESSEPRGVYLQMLKRQFRLTKKDEIIGPWFLDDNGVGLGFNDQWLKNIELTGGKSLSFLENGIYFIYAQVYYHFNSDELPEVYCLGFRINLKKKTGDPIHLAECVTPVLPTNSRLTCFTQVAWYVEHGDELYLDNILFTPNSRSFIENDRPGQTFLGIVKL